MNTCAFDVLYMFNGNKKKREVSRFLEKKTNICLIFCPKYFNVTACPATITQRDRRQSVTILYARRCTKAAMRPFRYAARTSTIIRCAVARAIRALAHTHHLSVATQMTLANASQAKRFALYCRADQLIGAAASCSGCRLTKFVRWLRKENRIKKSALLFARTKFFTNHYTIKNDARPALVRSVFLPDALARLFCCGAVYFSLFCRMASILCGE